MHDPKIEEPQYKFIESRIATDKDLKILELELCSKIENLERKLHAELNKLERYLITRLGGLLFAGFGILGYLVIWFKH